MNKYLLTMICACVLALSGCASKSTPQMPAPMNVYFAHASAKIDSADTKAIQNYIAQNDKFVKCPKSVVFVGGHTNSVGTVKYNDKLSQKRANAVRSVLVTAGVPNDKIHVKAYGSRAPIADNDTENGLKVNRRAEIGFMPVVVAKDCANGCGCGMQADKCTCPDGCACKTKKCPNSKRTRKTRCMK